MKNNQTNVVPEKVLPVLNSGGCSCKKKDFVDQDVILSLELLLATAEIVKAVLKPKLEH